MFQSRRGALVLGTAAFLLTLLYLHYTYTETDVGSTRGLKTRKGRLGDAGQVVVGDDKDGYGGAGLGKDGEYYENPVFKSSRLGGGKGVVGGGGGDVVFGTGAGVFAPGVAKPPGSNYTRALVVAKTKMEDVDWVYDASLGDVQKMVYTVDDKDAGLSVPRNKGHEVMVYLTYIIDHYDDLADVSVFMHAHRYAWHQNELLNNDGVEMVKRLSSERVWREGYVNLRCHWMPGCPEWVHPETAEVDVEKPEEGLMVQAWAELFPDRSIPEVLAQPCCAQFALSRERIHARRLERYMFYREWLLRTPWQDKISGRVWEYLWHVVFTDQAVFCPNQWACYCDAYGVCFEDEKQFDYWFELRWKRHVLEVELAKWREKADKVEEYRRYGKLVGIEASEVEIPLVDRDVEIVQEIDELTDIMEEGRMDAIERGTNPSIRAFSAGRRWAVGDGY